MRRIAFVRWPVLFFAGSVIAAACGDDSGDSDETGSAGDTLTGGRSGGGTGNEGGEPMAGSDQGGRGGTGGAAGDPGTTGGTGPAGGDAGGGGTDGGEAGNGGTGMSGSGGQTIGCGSANVIDDMEDGDAFLCLGSGRQGGWYNAKDTAGTIIPDVGVVITPSLLVPARGASTRGIHFQGSAFGTNGAWGLIGIGILATGGAPYDASGYQGITFWAKSDQGAVTINVKFPTVASTDSIYGGSCIPTTVACGDHWQVPRTVTGAWQQFTVYFPNNLSQLGWGVPVPKDLAHLLDVEFLFASSSSQSGFDFWIDDVEFY